MGKNKDVYAVFNGGVMQESENWHPTNDWCLIHKSGQVFPLSTFKIIVTDATHYSIEGAEYNKEDFSVCTMKEAACVLKKGTVVKSDEDGNRIKSPDDEIFKDLIKKLPNTDSGNFKPFTRCVLNAIKRDGKIIAVPMKFHNRRQTIIRNIKSKYSIGDAEIGIDDAIFLLGTFNLRITDILNEKYI